MNDDERDEGKRPDKVAFYKDSIGEWRWRRTAPNGEIVGASHEGYADRRDCDANFKRSLSLNYEHADTPDVEPTDPQE